MNKFYRNIFKRIIASILIFLVFVYAVSFICSIPRNFTIEKVDGKLKATVPFQTIIKKTNDSLLFLVKRDEIVHAGRVRMSKENFNARIVLNIKRTMILLLSGIVIGIVLGIIKGIFDSRRGKQKGSSIKVLSTIVSISLPDVLIIGFLQLLALTLSKNGVKILKVAGTGGVSTMILPMIALSVLPACYIARVTAMSIENCYEKEYIKTAVGKGCTNARILFNHVMRNAFGIIFEGLSNITALIICNLMLVEFMFSYSGIISLLTQYKNERFIEGMVLIIVIIGLIYFVLDNLFQIMKRATIKGAKEETA